MISTSLMMTLFFQQSQDQVMVRTDSRKANQRRRFQRQRLEVKKRLLELKQAAASKKEEA
jgi:hypothetical protein